MGGGRTDGIRRVLRLGGVARDIDEELAFHFEHTVAELMAAGMTRGAAEAEAARRFGDAAHYRRELERIDRSLALCRRLARRVEAARAVFASALRSVVRAPAQALGVIVVFTLGIGANATMLQTLDRLLLRAPDHVVAPGEVQRIYVESFIGPPLNARHATNRLTFPDVEDVRGASAFSGVAAYSDRDLTLGHGVDAERARALLVTGNYWTVLGIRPALGRFFDESEDTAGAERVVVLGHSYWQRRHGGDARVLGETIDFGHGAYTIIGVAPAGLTTLDLRPADVFVPLLTHTHAAGQEFFLSRRVVWLFAVARLAPGVSLDAAAAEATALHRAAHAEQIAAGDHDADARVLLASIIPARGPDSPPEAKVALWLGGVALIVLLIACLNVANLLLARALRQRREIGVRLALGISRRRLAAQLVLEGVLLALAGGAAALLLNRWAGDALRTRLLPDVAWDQLAPDGALLLVIVALAVLAGGLAALLPVLDATRRSADSIIRAGAGGITRSARRSRSVLGVVQAALCVVLLVGAGLFLRSIANVRAVDLGFDIGGVYFVDPMTVGRLELGERVDLFLDGVERVRRIPGVDGATASGMIPFANAIFASLRVPGRDTLPRAAHGGPYISVVERDYFRTLGVPLLRGRAFDERDSGAAEHVAIVNAALARALWPHDDPVGACILLGRDDRCTTVVGVVAEARHSRLASEEVFQIYVPATQARPETGGLTALLVRVRGEPARVLPLLRAELHAVDPRIRYAEIRPLRRFLEPQTRAWQLGATLFTAFGVLALIVAAVGLYSVIAFEVAERRREIGLRAALGASRPRVVRSVVLDAVRIAAVGIALGGAAALLLAPRLEGMLFDVGARDPLTVGGVALVLLVVAAAAAFAPAMRAAAVQPAEALRAE
jgi:putative ABC transport system permease protein